MAAAGRMRHATPLDEEEAHALLAYVGFLLVPGPPLDPGTAYLLVSLRPRPTREHYDPERIDYWAPGERDYVPTAIEWPMAGRPAHYSWGPITISDRVSANNTFISFGGTLTESRAGRVHAVSFCSSAPILALHGHSIEPDPLASQVATFLGQLRAVRGTNSRLRSASDPASPCALYAAFIERTLRSADHDLAMGLTSSRLLEILRRERRRVRLERPSDSALGTLIEGHLG